MRFRNETTNVLIGGYLSEQAAREDYEAVLNCGERIWGAAGDSDARRRPQVSAGPGPASARLAASAGS